MTLVQIDKQAGFSIDNALVEKFCRLQNDYKWIISHNKKLRKEYPNQYIAVENQSVRYAEKTVEALMASITKNSEKVENFAIEYINQQPNKLLF
ncbi:MAG: hypothetical protein ACFCUE_13655 [Candidatus Bathyarchaeia archaeon]